MKLVGPWFSGYTRRVGITLHLLGIPFEHLNYHAYNDRDAVRRYSPMGKVPALILDDGEVLLDSTSIIDHLHERVGPDRALLPPSGPQRRAALKLVGIALAIYDKLSGVFEESRRPVELRSPAVVGGLTEQALIGFRMLEDQAGSGWLIGDALSQADIITVIVYQMANRLMLPEQVNDAAFPRLAALADRAAGVDAFAATRLPL